MYVYVWLIVFVLSILVEAATAGLASIWFAGGAFAAFLLALFKVDPVWQIVAFVVISLLLLVFTRPLARKYINGRRQATNADRVVGMTGRITETVDNIAGTGAVYVAGKTWTARTKDGETIPEGALVRADAIEGVKLIVSPLGAEEPVEVE